MQAHWTERLRWWLCELIGHPFKREEWEHEGHHYQCACGRIITKAPTGGESGNGS